MKDNFVTFSSYILALEKEFWRKKALSYVKFARKTLMKLTTGFSQSTRSRVGYRQPRKDLVPEGCLSGNPTRQHVEKRVWKLETGTLQYINISVCVFGTSGRLSRGYLGSVNQDKLFNHAQQCKKLM